MSLGLSLGLKILDLDLVPDPTQGLQAQTT